MKKYLFMLLAAAVLCGCSKDDDGIEQDGGDDKVFTVLVPNYISRTRMIPVSLVVECDSKPAVTFSTEGDAMGVVSLTETPEFDTEYIYANELIDVVFANGTATAAFWYIPLSAGDHAVKFTIRYTQNGIAKTETSGHTLTVSDAFIGGFEPKLVHLDDGIPISYVYAFRNSPENNKLITGCDFRIAVKSFGGNAKSIGIEKAHITMNANENEFHPIRPQSWNSQKQEWETRDYFYVHDYIDHWGGTYREYISPSGPITLEFICRDNYNRCRDIVVKINAESQIVSTQLGEYYLWRNRK